MFKNVIEVSHDYQGQTKAINDAVAVGEKVNSANSQLSTLIFSSIPFLKGIRKIHLHN
ncbi:hypothetical protein LEQ_1440 [Ligilactobacillus equi DPC 6820]|uniref:Uncharacterized protein n=1 Tax=Ligilactobacillus equi DPC 6820 TaxID=1392007 RepID=V7I0F2_9LACO|nr:hypothetical protein LEQ_1440 [Ligilactobacillus equi DPC 6820]